MDSISLAILIAVISSGATAAVVKAIDNWLSWKRERKAKREDSDLEKKAVEIAVKHFRPTGESLDSYIPGCVIEDLAIENGLHKEDNRYNDIDF